MSFFIEYNDAEFDDNLSILAKAMNNYELAFINHMDRVLQEEMVRLREEARRGVPYDTGTLERRVDFKRLRWNNYAFGQFEPYDKYTGAGQSTAADGTVLYDVNKHQYPIKSGRNVQYATYNLAYNSWGTLGMRATFDHIQKVIDKESVAFTEKYFDKKIRWR